MFIKLMRLGRDAEPRTTSNGKNVVEVSAAYDVGYGDNKKTQWIKLSFWRDNAPVNLMIKGVQIVANIRDVHVEEYQKKDGGTGAVLRGTLIDFEFAGRLPQQDAQQQPQPQQRTQQRTQQSQAYGMNQYPPVQQPANFDQFDGSIPF